MSKINAILTHTFSFNLTIPEKNIPFISFSLIVIPEDKSYTIKTIGLDYYGENFEDYPEFAYCFKNVTFRKISKSTVEDKWTIYYTFSVYVEASNEHPDVVEYQGNPIECTLIVNFLNKYNRHEIRKYKT